MVQTASLSINFPPPYQGASPKSVVQYLNQNISFYEKWQNIVASIQTIALRVIATALACTALLYSSPILPIIGLIGIGAFSAITFPHTSFLSYLSIFLLMPFTFGLTEKIKILAYTRQVATTVLLANSIILGIAGATLLLLASIKNFMERKKLYFQNVRTHALRLESDPTYSPPKEEAQALLILYKKVHINPFVHGFTSILPYQLEEQMARLGWERG